MMFFHRNYNFNRAINILKSNEMSELDKNDNGCRFKIISFKNEFWNFILFLKWVIKTLNKINLRLEMILLIARMILIFFSLKLKKKNRVWELSSCCGWLLRSRKKKLRKKWLVFVRKICCAQDSLIFWRKRSSKVQNMRWGTELAS